MCNAAPLKQVKRYIISNDRNLWQTMRELLVQIPGHKERSASEGLHMKFL